MSKKNNLLRFHSISAGAMSGTSVLTSPVTSLQYLDDVGVQFTWTGSPVGNFRIQISADYAQDTNGNVTNAGTWVPLLFSYWNGSAFITSYDVPTSLGSPIYLDMALLSAPWVRLQYTNASSSGVLNAWITAKALA